MKRDSKKQFCLFFVFLSVVSCGGGRNSSESSSPVDARSAKPSAKAPVAVPISSPGASSQNVCGDCRDDLIRIYQTFKPSALFQCGQFTQSRGGEFFPYEQLKGRGDCTWSLIRDPLIVDKSKGYGLNMFREAYGEDRQIESAYRDPARNLQVGGATTSRHLFGDAADIRNDATRAAKNASSADFENEWQQFLNSTASGGDSQPPPSLEDRCIQLTENPASKLAKPCAEWLRMKDAANKSGARYIEPLNLPCQLNCLHADWRGVPGDYR